jgi:hypothetical protein
MQILFSVGAILLSISTSSSVLANYATVPSRSTQEQGESSTECRSNETHIAWRSPVTTSSVRARSLREDDTSRPFYCSLQPIADAQRGAYNYLRQRVIPFDVPFLETMGFHSNGDDSPDGLADGLIGTTIEYAIRTKVLLAYTDALPLEIWQEYVLNYLHLNEARSNWRPFLFDKLSPLVLVSDDNGSLPGGLPTSPANSIPEAVRRLNTDMWKILAAISGRDAISFVSGSTPLIFDPMSVLVFGYASCTGLAILFASALRAVGVPARVAGTPSWNGDRDRGNHNWVEVWHEGQWYFLEPSASAQTPDAVDTLERDVCKRWFCNSARWENGTQAYAARLEQGGVFFRLAWEWNNVDLPAEDHTSYYQEMCSQC